MFMKEAKSSGRIKSIFFSLAKYLLAFGLLYLAISSADSEKIYSYISQIGYESFFLSALFLILAQCASAERMRFYAKEKGVKLGFIYSLKLYYVGMFYNNILPSGIGGDGYKALVINKIHHLSFKKSVQIMLSDRANGMLALLIILYTLVLMSGIYNTFPYGLFLTLALIAATIPCYLIASKILMSERAGDSAIALCYSMIVQVISLLASISIITGLGFSLFEFASYQNILIVYLAASILSAVLPISVGGIGIREISFVYAAFYIDIDTEKAIAFSVGYYVVYFAISLIGLFYLNAFKIFNNRA